MHVEESLLFILAGVGVIVAIRMIAERTGLPAAALLTIVGITYAVLPGPNVELEPELIMTYVIPPLLYSAALDASLLDIRRHIRTVVSLSVLLVLATALLIGVGLNLWVTGATLAAGIALGAAVAPPDPVAALAVGRRAGLPPKIITLIQGEGLLNDATALTILTVAIAATEGDGFSFPGATWKFFVMATGGVVAGVVVAYVVRYLRHLRHDPLTANAISLATPLAAYVLAESVHVSGVLAVVVAGLIIGHDSSRHSVAASRLQTTAVWRLVDFLLEGLVFLLIGQQLPNVVEGLSDYDTSTVVIAVAVTVGVTLLLRPLWLILTQLLPRSLHMRLGGDPAPVGEGEESAADAARLERIREKALTGKEVTALSWAGTRGVISLAAIFTLPETVPQRDLLHFCAFVVVLVTLLGQGLTFAPLVQWLGLRANKADEARERNEARSASVQAALARLDEIQREQHDHVEDVAIEHMRKQLEVRLERYRRRLDMLEKAESDEVPVSPQYEAALVVRRKVIEAQREELLRWRDAGNLNDEGLRILERELDHEERLLPERGARAK
ncbi:cation:proton antiporter [Paractinoplanes brasiliensis]|uniref:Sodium/proton antiporter (CPA1 family) n=1 Tax=Paractinoplanes brasiliensis TaxID=52695 RepID=A0A4R6JRD6_9ACTN|nr:cation:proton antiporter [Actinoplanes brasiliensis]TDO38979.1 sodium/proton antiporter (CPA1 family) [Actinoplanes brasiliensis]GID33193.1 cation:proton antiporter [Actinoplanes brasiliensis]